MTVRTDFTITKGSTFSRTFTKYSEDYFNVRGEWSSLGDYDVDDVITYKNVVYKCILAHTTAFAPPNVTYWSTPTAYDYSAGTHVITAKLRSEYDSETVATDFTISWITDGSDGKFKISLSATVTAAFLFKDATYDVEVTDGTTTWKEAYGKIAIRDEVTY